MAHPHIRIEGGRPHVYGSRDGAFDCYGTFAEIAKAWPVIIERISKMSDTVVDKVAKLLTPPEQLNWHLYRGFARAILAEAAHLKTGELSSILAEPDREITHEELLKARQ